MLEQTQEIVQVSNGFDAADCRSTSKALKAAHGPWNHRGLRFTRNQNVKEMSLTLKLPNFVFGEGQKVYIPPHMIIEFLNHANLVGQILNCPLGR